MHSRSIVVPTGQIPAVAVPATVSWKAWPLGREHPRVPVGCATAFTESMVKGHPDMVQMGTPYMHRKGHSMGVLGQKMGGSSVQGV